MPNTTEQFPFDVFLSHSSKDKDVVREVAIRLQTDGLKVWFDEWALKPGDSIPAKIEDGLENSRILILCMSVNAFGSDWATLETGTFRFRDPLNKDRRFIPLRLDDTPIKGSLAQFLYIDWQLVGREKAYQRLIEACRPLEKLTKVEAYVRLDQDTETLVQLPCKSEIRAYAFSPDGTLALTGATDKTVRLWDLQKVRCRRVFKGHANGNPKYGQGVWCIAVSPDQRRAMSGGCDGPLRSGYRQLQTV